jgi:hypothetical protein
MSSIRLFTSFIPLAGGAKVNARATGAPGAGLRRVNEGRSCSPPARVVWEVTFSSIGINIEMVHKKVVKKG